MASSWLFRLLRFVVRIPPPKISKEDAISIALIECKKRGWTLKEPAVIDELHTWRVTGFVKGGPWIAIDQQTGLVVRRGSAPR
ncbi:MAG: hypothetical protein HQ567_21270 [Candidatus Nealsonbacteria bacterium]|nr:hypothetical protein [Candidatus Nealsonbacteria bacterium]